MAEEKPSLHIDNDWKRQAQEEKKRLIEEEEAKKAKASAAPVAPAGSGAAGGPGAAVAPRAGGAGRALPAAGFGALVQSILTQILYYLGDLSTRGGDGQVNFDMAKYQLDMLNSLEDKTKGNLTEEEKQLLDTALYETRMRFVNVASQYIS
jgi:hypothetical protein